MKNKKNQPREQGKNAYREGKRLEDNPYSGAAAEEWIEGWIYCQVHYPNRKDRKIERLRLVKMRRPVE